MKCENCENEHTGEYGSGRFCSSKCARGFSTKLKRAEINKKVSQKTRGRKFTFTEEQRRRGAETKNRNLREKKKIRIESLAFDELKIGEKRIRIFNEQQECCSVCGLKEWNGQPITLELDHISGNRKDESRDNLRLICPNCHSQTHTYKVKNVDSPGKRKYTDDQIAEVLLTEDSLYKVLTKLGMNPHGGNYTRLRRIIKERGIRQDLIF